MRTRWNKYLKQYHFKKAENFVNEEGGTLWEKLSK